MFDTIQTRQLRNEEIEKAIIRAVGALRGSSVSATQGNLIIRASLYTTITPRSILEYIRGLPESRIRELGIVQGSTRIVRTGTLKPNKVGYLR